MILYLVPVSNERSTAYISHILQEADLPDLVPLDSVDQIKYFLEERAHMINQVCSKFSYFFL